MKTKVIISRTLILLILIVYVSSCNRSGNDGNENTTSDTDSIVEVQEDFNEATQIFYSLPAPHEVASILMENQDAFFNEDILNPVHNVNRYNTSMSMALNLGIYTADLSYASLFEQNQIVVSYMATAKDLAEELGILEAFGNETITNLEDNINDRDAIIRIISENYMNSDAYLQENNREEIAAMIIIGGWIEGMYIAVQLSEKDASKNMSLVSSIVEQQLSLILMVEFLQSYKGNQGIADLLHDVNKLNDIFQGLNPEVAENGDLTVKQNEYTALCNELETIRNKFVENV